MNLTSDLNGGSVSGTEKPYGNDVGSGGQDLFAGDGSADFSDVFLLGGNTWDYNDCSMIPENYFSPRMFEDDAATMHSPKAFKAEEGQAIPMPAKTEMRTAEIPMSKATPVTKQSSTNNMAQPRRKSGGPNGTSTHNWYNICQQPNTSPGQGYQPSGLAYAQTSPFLEWNTTATSPGLMNADPYSWMHSGRPKRSGGFGGYPMGTMASPPMMYQNGFPGMGMFGGAVAQSPQFGYMNPMFMVNQSAPKLPVQALPPRAEMASVESVGPGVPMMAPLILPTDLGKRKSPSDPEIDPTAISAAISAALSRSTGDASSPTSSNASLSPSGIPSSASQTDNMKLYESTFESFVKEESAIDYTNVTVIELKKLLRKYHLAATGKKEELIRLVKDVAQFLKGSPPKADALSPRMEETEQPQSLGRSEEKDYSKFFEMS